MSEKVATAGPQISNWPCWVDTDGAAGDVQILDAEGLHKIRPEEKKKCKADKDAISNKIDFSLPLQ